MQTVPEAIVSLSSDDAHDVIDIAFSPVEIQMLAPRGCITNVLVELRVAALLGTTTLADVMLQPHLHLSKLH